MIGYQALIFDCDGTLADSMPAHYLAWCATLPRYGLHLPEDRFYALGGVPTARIVQMLGDEAGLTLDPHTVAAEKEAHFHANLSNIMPIEPVLAIARQHHGKLPMAVATGSLRHTAEPTLRQINALHLFDTLVCTEDVANPKPAPDIYLEAARRLGVAPRHCRVYEDTETGIQGATAAGMDVVDVRIYQKLYTSAP